MKLAAALQSVSSFLFFLSPKSFAVASSVHHMFKYEVIVFVIPNVWVCRKGMTSRLQQLCVQPSRTPVSLPKVLSNPSDPWWILHKHAKNTIYWDYTFKIKWMHLKKACTLMLEGWLSGRLWNVFTALAASKFAERIRSEVEWQEPSNTGFLAVNVWFLWCCRKIIQHRNIDMLLPEPCPIKMSGCHAEIKDSCVGGSLDFHVLNASCRHVPAGVTVTSAWKHTWCCPGSVSAQDAVCPGMSLYVFFYVTSEGYLTVW